MKVYLVIKCDDSIGTMEYINRTGFLTEEGAYKCIEEEFSNYKYCDIERCYVDGDLSIWVLEVEVK